MTYLFCRFVYIHQHNDSPFLRIYMYPDNPFRSMENRNVPYNQAPCNLFHRLWRHQKNIEEHIWSLKIEQKWLINGYLIHVLTDTILFSTIPLVSRAACNWFINATKFIDTCTTCIYVWMYLMCYVLIMHTLKLCKIKFL